MTSNQVYRSILLDPQSVYEKYYGWNAIVARSEYRVLFKRFGPINRYLVLSQLDQAHLLSNISEERIFETLSIVNIKDFSSPNHGGAPALILSGRRVPRAKNADRMLNKHTFVIDLTSEIDKLWSTMIPNFRRVCKRAIASDLAIECISSPDEGILTIFFDRYQKMAAERSLAMPNRKIITQMFKDGCLRMFYGRTENTIHTMIMVYSLGQTSLFMYGVSGEKKNDGSGQLTHWRAIEYLRRAGQHWYDLGGVPEVEDANGIYRFKRGFGGELIDLGPEYYYCPGALAIAKLGYRQLRKYL